MLRVYSFNERAIRTYRRIGFQEIGRRRESHRLGGKAYDVIYMDCLAAEFKGMRLLICCPFNLVDFSILL